MSVRHNSLSLIIASAWFNTPVDSQALDTGALMALLSGLAARTVQELQCVADNADVTQVRLIARCSTLVEARFSHSLFSRRHDLPPADRGQSGRAVQPDAAGRHPALPGCRRRRHGRSSHAAQRPAVSTPTPACRLPGCSRA